MFHIYSKPLTMTKFENLIHWLYSYAYGSQLRQPNVVKNAEMSGICSIRECKQAPNMMANIPARIRFKMVRTQPRTCSQ